MANPEAQRFPGLTKAEAAHGLKTHGYNELPTANRRRMWQIAFGVVREPMFLLLLASGIIYLVLGEARDAAMLLGFVFVIIGITLYQERKTERALDALRDLASPRALVLRDGEVTRIPGREVVPDDIVLLVEGDRVPADAVVLDSNHLMLDESLLTGESMPVRKIAGDPQGALGRPGGDDLPGVYSGTIVVQGQGVVRDLLFGGGRRVGHDDAALCGFFHRDVVGPAARTDDGAAVRNHVKMVQMVGTYYQPSTEDPYQIGITGGLRQFFLCLAFPDDEFNALFCDSFRHPVRHVNVHGDKSDFE